MSSKNPYPAELTELYRQLIDTVVAKQSAYKEKELVLFGGIHTERYSNGLMVVGRAVHGWSHGFSLKNEHNTESRLERFHHGVSRKIVFHKADKEKCFTPSNRSALWRVTRRVAEGVTNVIQDPQNIFYSNLYRVSNQEWNPSIGLRNVQLEICKQILAAEVKIFRPKLILILTGYEWAQPFASYLDCSLQNFNPSKYVEKAGNFEKSIVIISKHPMAKPEEPHVKELLSTIVSCQQ